MYIDFNLASNLLNVNNIKGNAYTAISSVLASLHIIVILFTKKFKLRSTGDRIICAASLLILSSQIKAMSYLVKELWTIFFYYYWCLWEYIRNSLLIIHNVFSKQLFVFQRSEIELENLCLPRCWYINNTNIVFKAYVFI